MPNVCYFTGKKTTFGRKLRYRGQKIKKGGFGLKMTGKNRRKFKANLQNVRAVIDGKPVRVKASTKAIRMGLVVKPLRRKHGYTAQQKAANQAD
ncbi:MAG TPA: 50S ribosomal protein L28 [Phycisphaeraceae bacterium]|nr:50S ribosomal protein L28 [Phycisphaeraceae bacterium]